MRPLFALLLACIILGSVQGYMIFQRSVAARQNAMNPDDPSPAVAAGNYQIRATLAFNAAPEAFQLHPAALIIYREGAASPVARYAEPVAKDVPATLEVDDTQLHPGANQLVVEAWLPEAREDRDAAIDLDRNDDLSRKETSTGSGDSAAPDDSAAPSVESYSFHLEWTHNGKVFASHTIQGSGDTQSTMSVRGLCTLELP